LNTVAGEAMTETIVDIDKLTRWAEDFKTAGNVVRLGILFMLCGSEILSEKLKSLTFGQMREILGYPNTSRANSNLAYHLSALIDARFIEKEPLQIEKGSSGIEVIYHLSPKGRQFLGDFSVLQVMKEKLGKKT